jgi:Ca-activated chloride channel family protein
MKPYLLTPVLSLIFTSVTFGSGLLIPVEPDLPPLAMLNHHVDVSLEDQVSVTKVQQTFRNHTDRQLEATFVFPVPEGASVREFAMWVDGKRAKGELLKADKAKTIYTRIVRQTKNPALLDYIGSDLLSLKIFPIPANGDQKIEVSFTAVAKRQHEVVEYVYPLKSDRAAASTLEEFRLTVNLKSQQPIASIYSPTHEVAVKQANDHQASVQFEEVGASLDRDFQLFYTTSGQDIGVTALQHRPISAEDGYVMLLVSPRAELAKHQKVPRDIVFVVDTSGSMRADKKIEQAKDALRHCLGGLSADDRFGLINFATTVNRYRDNLVAADEEHVKHAKGWVSDLYAGGGTAMHGALQAALGMRTDDPGRMFTVVFFTDGQPTIGEQDTEKILADMVKKNTANTRIFTMGLGHDLNAAFLDQIAEKTRAVSDYVQPEQSIETKVATFFGKIHHPVLANLKLSTNDNVQLAEVYPPELPDLFHGDQLVVMARYQGKGHAAIMLDGKVGMHDKRFVYELNFESQTEGKPFVEELWARRKVGYLLDQIRINGEQKELVDEVVALAKTYSITTPYTSFLIMPDALVQVASADGGLALGRLNQPGVPAVLTKLDAKGEKKRQKLTEFAIEQQQAAGGITGGRGRFNDELFKQIVDYETAKDPSAATPARKEALERIVTAQTAKGALDLALTNNSSGQWRRNQIGVQGVNYAHCTNSLKCQTQLKANAIQRVASRNCMEFGGVWIDEGYTPKTKTVSVKAQSDAYFQILAKQPQMKDVFKLGNHVLWIAPNGTALVIDSEDGKDKITDREIDMLFASK